MHRMKYLTSTGVALALFIQATAAHAQVAPSGRTISLSGGPTASAPAKPTAAAPQAQTTGTTAPKVYDRGGIAILSSLTSVGELPRAATTGSIGSDSPTIERDAYFKRYPSATEADWNTLVAANADLCKEGREIMTELMDISGLLLDSKAEYKALEEVYNRLPSNVKRTAVIMTLAQAAQVGALCALSGGYYCIAVAVGAVGNVFGIFSNRKLQLENIRLSLANIRLTNANIRLQLVSVRLNSYWVRTYLPKCAGAGHLPD